MGVALRIGRFIYEFRTARGRQFIRKNGVPEEVGCIRSDAAKTITVSDSLPQDERLAIAAQEALLVAQEQAPCGFKWVEVASADRSPIPGIPLIIAPGNAMPLPPEAPKH